MKYLITLLLFLAASGSAFGDAGAKRVAIVRGRNQIVVTTPSVRLSDVADISVNNDRAEDTLLKLRQLVVADSPIFGKSEDLTANQVLDHIRAAGFDLNQIGYVLPSVINIRRASRPISSEEIKSAIEAVLFRNKQDVAIKQVNFPSQIEVAPGKVEFEAIPLATMQPGHLAFNIKAKSADSGEVAFEATANVDEYGEVPVARHPLQRGEIVSDDDVMHARMNLAQLPRDIASSADNLIGLRLGRSVGTGDVFRLDGLSVPPVIESGNRVTMRVRSGILEATATGTALESGTTGQIIKVKNDSSRRVVSGAIIEPGLVEVRQ